MSDIRQYMTQEQRDRWDWLSPPVNGRYGPRGAAIMAHTLYQLGEEKRRGEAVATRKAHRRARWFRLLHPWRRNHG